MARAGSTGGSSRIASEITYTSLSPCARLSSVSVRQVRVLDGFWKPRIENNRRRAIPRLLTLLKEHGVVDAFLISSGKMKEKRRGLLFTDSDLYKWIEAVAYDLASGYDADRHRTLKELADIVLDAQEKSGYLNTYFVGELQDQRFQRPESHEFYCAGHLIQAAIAYYRATGDRKLLEGAIKFANYLNERFGPGKEETRGDHPNIEMALVELYRTTRDKRYLDLAAYLLSRVRLGPTAEKPDVEIHELRSMRKIHGHAVRATYAMCGGTEYYAETGDCEFWGALQSIWQDMVTGKMYITGGIGSRYAGEAFGETYELPNLLSYAETCAAVGNMLWNWRMLAVTGDSRYADLFERILYNGFLSGVSLDGEEYFYVNPLESLGNHARREWYDCTCCPPNVLRTLASLPAYFYSTDLDGIWVHLYDNSEAQLSLSGDLKVSVEQKTRYPWDGKVDLKVSPGRTETFSLYLRVPSWTPRASVSVNREAATEPKTGGYFKTEREWSEGDEVHLSMDIPITPYESNPKILENRGRIAITRGPIVYCFESVDNPGMSMFDLELILDPKEPETTLTQEFKPDLLGGVTVIKGKALVPRENRNRLPLYVALGSQEKPESEEVEVLAIPYYAWANRGRSQMIVWVPYRTE